MEYVKIVGGPNLRELRKGNMRGILEFTIEKDGKQEQKSDLVEIEELRDGTVIVMGAREWQGRYIPLE
ncbi:MAG: hypothetical protein WC470_03470 [Candidatus Paceibacterota bacterium]